jgi:hypothetical protein
MTKTFFILGTRKASATAPASTAASSRWARRSATRTAPARSAAESRRCKETVEALLSSAEELKVQLRLKIASARFLVNELVFLIIWTMENIFTV